jgi:hypothetical protein
MTHPFVEQYTIGFTAQYITASNKQSPRDELHINLL